MTITGPPLSPSTSKKSKSDNVLLKPLYRDLKLTNKTTAAHDTLLQGSPGVLNLSQHGMCDIAGIYLAYGVPIEIKRLSPLCLRLTCNGTSISLTEGFDHLGSSIWLSALALIGWIAANGKVLLRDRQILELGSGIGVVGLFAGAYASPQNVRLTDGAHMLVSLEEHNVQLNPSVRGQCDVLEWGSGKVDSADVILAAHCVYRNNKEDFLRAVLDHLRPGGSLYMVNPLDSTQAGIDVLLYALKEHGEACLEEITINYYKYADSFHKTLLLISFQRL